MKQYSIDYIIDMLMSDMSIEEIMKEIERRNKEHEQTKIRTENTSGSEN